MDSTNKKIGNAINNFNGYDFDNPKTRKRMKYLVITKGDLDLNGAYAFKSKKELEKYFEDNYQKRDTEAVFIIQDVSHKYL